MGRMLLGCEKLRNKLTLAKPHLRHKNCSYERRTGKVAGLIWYNGTYRERKAFKYCLIKP